MSCLGVTGKPMVVTVKCGVESDLECEMKEYCITHEHTWVGVGILRMNFPAKKNGWYMDHVLWKGLYADRVRTNWCFGTKDQTRVTSCKHFFQGKCIEIHVGYDKETGKANRCGE